MLAITRKADYAIVAMADLASRAPLAGNTREMSRRLQVPLPALRKIMTRLMRRGLVVSTKGPEGGYFLERPPETITLAELIDAIEGPFKLTLCSGPTSNGDERECHMQEVCPVREPVRQVHNLLERFLGQVSVAQVASHTVPHAFVLAVGPESGGDEGAETIG